MRRFFTFLALGTFAPLLVVACSGRILDGGSNTPTNDAPNANVVHVQGDVIERTCVFKTTCAPGYPTSNDGLADCLAEYRFGATVDYLPGEAWMSCAETATTCDAWIDCLNYHHGNVCGGGGEHVCIGDVAFNCPGGDDYFVSPPMNCALHGMKCEVARTTEPYLASDAICTTEKICDPTLPSTCTDENGALFCDANTYYETYAPCADPYRLYASFVGSAATCEAAKRCVDTGSVPCTTPGVTCDGTIATDCSAAFAGAPLTAVTFDCAKSGQRCKPRGDSATPACVPIPVDCEPASFAPSCTGTTLDLCVLGKIEHVDCAAYGSTCNANASGCGP